MHVLTWLLVYWACMHVLTWLLWLLACVDLATVPFVCWYCIHPCIYNLLVFLYKYISGYDVLEV